MTEVLQVVLASLFSAVILFIIAKSAKRPLNPEDMELKPKHEHIGTEILMDGNIENNLIRKRAEQRVAHERTA